MIDFIKGTVTQKSFEYVVVDCNDIGYRLFVSQKTSEKLETDKTQTIYTKLMVREDDMQLVGFYDITERDMFELLMGVSKIGMKTALNILSLYDADQVVFFIKTSDVDSLAKVSGIGKKTAERIILELKDKVKSFAVQKNYGSLSNIPQIFSDNKDENEAIEALAGLGFTLKEAQYAVEKATRNGKDIGVEEMIRQSLNYLRK